MNEQNLTTAEELKGMSLEEIVERINAVERELIAKDKDLESYKGLYDYASREGAKKQAKLDALKAVINL